MQRNRLGGSKKLAHTPTYSSPSQLSLFGFETPFERHLNADNRWVRMAHLIPWDKIVSQYDKCFASKEGRPAINGRVVIGALIIKHLENLSDRATLNHISENVYMQYFLGYSSFTDQAPFTAPLFVDLRKRLSLDILSSINEVIAHCALKGEDNQPTNTDDEDLPPQDPPPTLPSCDINLQSENETPEPPHKGTLLMDATVAPQDITFPTDVKLLNAARLKTEQLIDLLYYQPLHGSTKPRTYRQLASKTFLDIQKKRHRPTKAIYKAVGQQLRFLRRNLEHIYKLLQAYETNPLNAKQYKYLLVIQKIYEQQLEMHHSRSHRVADRIVSLHQPHLRPIVRGKDRQNVEFGAKLQVSLVEGFIFIDKLGWDAYNEGGYLRYSVMQYRKRFGCYPQEVLADKIYCTRENRKWLKELGIRLSAKPLGRPSQQAVKNHIRPGDRNPIEGKFGQAKVKYGLNLVRARLKETSESWIACIALVLNLVRWAGKALLCLYLTVSYIIQSLHQPFNRKMSFAGVN